MYAIGNVSRDVGVVGGAVVGRVVVGAGSGEAGRALFSACPLRELINPMLGALILQRETEILLRVFLLVVYYIRTHDYEPAVLLTS